MTSYKFTDNRYMIVLCFMIVVLSSYGCTDNWSKSKTRRFVNKDVTIVRHDMDLTLAATLSVPTGSGPHPAVLFLTGSGGHTRDQVISGLPMFEVIGNFLAENGYAVLRVDDRGEGSSTGPKVRASSTMDRAEDAQAALAFLISQPEIDTTQIGLLGHSEGTHTAAMVAAELDDVDFVIMLSPWAIPGSELWVWQQGTLLRDEGEFSEDKIRSIEAELLKMVTHIGSSNSDIGFFKYGAAACIAWGDPPEDINHDFITEAFGDLRQPWYEHFFSSNPKHSLVKLKQPLLALFGSEDKQTPPGLNVKYLSEYLIEASNSNFTIKVLPNEDHFFMTGEGLKPNEHVHGKMEISESALNAIKYWLDEQFIGKYDQKKNTDPVQERFVKGDTVKELGNSIMVVYQDKKNIYWFGSWETGVYRYDGTTLINFTTEHGLPNNRIDEIKEDQSGHIYFTSCHPNSTISKFDGTTFTTLSAISSNDWKLNSTDMWFKHSFRNEKVYRYDGISLYELQLPKPPNLSNPFEIYSIYKDRKGNIWFGTNPVGVCRYDGKSFDWITEEDVTEFRNEGANGVRSITEDKTGDFWFNTEYRYRVYDSVSLNRDKFYSRHESIGGLDGKKDSDLDEYLSIVRDNNNDLWFVTYLNGVWKYDGTKITHYAVQDNSKDITLFSIYKDNNGDLWLGTDGNGAYQFNGETFVKFGQ